MNFSRLNHKLKTIILLSLAIVVGLIALNFAKGKSKTKKVIINNQTILVEIADTDEERSRGLSGKVSLAKDTGMLFIFPLKGNYSFWMRQMLIPLDFIWIDGETIVDLTENVPAPTTYEKDINLQTYSPTIPIDKVLEVNAGVVKSLEVKIGDKVTFHL